MNSSQVLGRLAFLLSLTVFVGLAGAATNLTGLSATNRAVPADHGSNAPGTPDIVLTWSGNWDQWSPWDGRGDVYQIEGAFVGSPLTITLDPGPGQRVRISSFDLDEWIGGGNTEVGWTVTGPVSGSLARGQWDDFNAANDPADNGGRATISPQVTGANGEALTIAFEQTDGDRTYLALDNLSFDQVAAPPDNTIPTVLDIVDDRDGGPVFDNETMGYAITFSEPINPSTVDTGDFEMAGRPQAVITSVAATDNPAEFRLSLFPGRGEGTMQLQIKASAVIEDFSGNALATSPSIVDCEIIRVNASSFALRVSPSGSGFDFTWDSRPGLVYDLLSSDDLSAPISTWRVHDDGSRAYENIPASGSTTTIQEVPAAGRRFFAVRERDDLTILNVLSWNIWTADRNFGKINEVIEATEADIIGFQELGGVGSAVSSLEAATGEDWHSHGMIVSRHPIISTSGGGAQIQISPAQSVWVFNIHFRAYPYQPYDLRDGTLASNEAAVIAAAENTRGAQADSLVNAITNSGAMAAGIPVFVTGDFNEPSHLDWTQTAAEATARPYDLKVAYPASKKMTDLGLADAFRTVWPDEVARPGYTWTPGIPPPTVSADEVHDRIDFVYFQGPGVAVLKALNVGYDPTNPNTDLAIPGYPSDHRAVLATFAISRSSP